MKKNLLTLMVSLSLIFSYVFASTAFISPDTFGGFNIITSYGDSYRVTSDGFGGYVLYDNNIDISVNTNIPTPTYSTLNVPANPAPTTQNSSSATLTSKLDNAILQQISGKSALEICQERYGINTTLTSSDDPMKDELCTCKDGYVWAANGAYCIQQTPQSMCSYFFGSNVHTDGIKNTDGTYNCYCDAGYVWGDTQKNCVYSPESATTTTTIISTNNSNNELQDAYDYAHGIGITTATSIENADMDGYLLRSHMAKMMVNYAIEVLGLIPNTSETCNFNDISDQSNELQGYIIKACQLGLMGIGINEFIPNGLINRAQFGTVFSRALYGYTYNGGTPYYTYHLQALKNAGIMNNISDPNALEIRGYVMLMMQRADQ